MNKTKAHKKSVNAIWSSESGGAVVSGGSDGRVMVWTAREEKAGIHLVLVTEFTISGSQYDPVR